MELQVDGALALLLLLLLSAVSPPSTSRGVSHSACLQSGLLHPSLSVKLSISSLHYSPLLSASLLFVSIFLLLFFFLSLLLTSHSFLILPFF